MTKPAGKVRHVIAGFFSKLACATAGHNWVVPAKTHQLSLECCTRCFKERYINLAEQRKMQETDKITRKVGPRPRRKPVYVKPPTGKQG